MKDKHIELKLGIIAILMLLTGIFATQCQAQKDIVKRTVTIDSLRSRGNDTIWIVNGTGGKTWIRIENDSSLYLGDANGEASLSALMAGGGYVGDTIIFSNGAFITCPVSGNGLILHAVNSDANILEVNKLGGGYLNQISTDILQLPPLTALPSVTQIGQIIVSDVDSNLYIFRRGDWQLVGSGGSSSLFMVSNDTIFLIDGSQVINLSNGTSKPKITINNSSTGFGSTINNSSTGIGSTINNSSTGFGSTINNSSTGFGGVINNNSTGIGGLINNNSTGIGNYITNNSTGIAIKVVSGSTGDVFLNIFGSDTTLKITSTGGALFSDSVELKYEGTATNERPLGLSKTGKIKSINLPQSVQIEVTTETLVSGADSVDVLTIPEALADMNLIKMEAYPGSVAGDRTMSVNAYRNRSGTVTTMTSSGASFSVNATIDTNYDDVTRGDKIFIGWTFTGGTTDPVGLKVQLTFREP